MRLLMVGAANSIHIQRWANAFAARGIDTHLITLHEPLSGYHARIAVHRLPFSRGAGYLLQRRAARVLAKRIAPDAINAHYATGYGSLAPKLRNAPLVLNVWGSDVFEFPDSSPLHRALLRRNLLRADTVVSTSHVMADRTRQVCPRIGTIPVVPFGVDLNRFGPAPDKRSGPLTVGTVKTLAPKYGIDTLIDAFARIASQERFRDTRLRIVGGGPDLARLTAQAERTGLLDRIDFIGPVAHDLVPDELRKLDIYVALSRADSESFGVAVIEASACGLPVIVSRAGGLPEVVEDNVTGLVVPKEDAAAAARAMELLLVDAGTRRAMGSAGRERVQRQYAWEHCVDLQLAVISKAIQGRKK